MRLKFNTMVFAAARSLLTLFVSGVFATSVSAQTTTGKPAALKRIEPGLETAVKWEWHVEPSDDEVWRLHAPEPPPPVTVVPRAELRPTVYEVKRGDALFLIGKKFGITVSQIKAVNGLKDDKIRAGQMLKIPSLSEISAMPTPAKKKPVESPDSKVSPETSIESDRLRLQILLDREQFSAGPIVAEPGPTFARVLLLYRSTHEDAKEDASLLAKAQAAVPNVFANYKLKADDFRFIMPPKAETVEAKPAPVVTPARVAAHPPTAKPVSRLPAITLAPQTYKELVAMSMLAYRTPWEFVAERFHCRQSYLRTLNEKLPATPGIGAEFRVPNVIPFEIEKTFDGPLQPQVDPKNPVTAAVIGLTQLNIYRGGVLVAALPLSPARPGLHGKNSWTILDLIPHPRLATFQKERKEQPRKAGSFSASASLEPTPPLPNAALPPEQYLAAGPRNPVGIFWINLAKSSGTEPLPYGLHGTSIPDQMNIEESIGGFRLTNWDIARVVRLLPSGTPLEWK